MNAPLAVQRYAVVIAWSDEDQAYIASFPDFPTLRTHGATRREALENAEQVLDMAAEVAARHGRVLPQGRSK
ncbi:MAG TPA: type II toxin-antitoxin system HicB family antitoxin [Ktedonobacterales bacterium]|jgi:predicted RNase H-like HicB family nuclease